MTILKTIGCIEAAQHVRSAIDQTREATPPSRVLWGAWTRSGIPSIRKGRINLAVRSGGQAKDPVSMCDCPVPGRNERAPLGLHRRLAGR